MKKILSRLLIPAVLILLITGCAYTVKTKSPEEPIHYDERYSYVDLKLLADRMSESALANPPILSREDKPVIIIYGISNRTSEHIDMKAITDGIRTRLAKSQKVRFVSEAQRENIEKEIGMMVGRVTPETRIKLGAQVGAEYMLTGTMYSIEKEQPRQVRLGKKRLQYYKLTMELTNIKTALIEWTDEQEIVREATKPFIGW